MAATAETGAPGRRAPLYSAVYEALRDALHAGSYEVGASLPSEAELSDRFAVSRITVRHALRLLEGDGYIRKARARRPVVIATTPAQNPGWAVKSIDDIVAMVGDAQLLVRSWRKEAWSVGAGLLALPAATPLFCLRSVLVRRGKPYARSIIYFPPQIGARLTRGSFDDAVVFRVLQRELGLRIANVRLTVWAELATAEDAASLGCEAGAALLVSQLLYQDEAGRPIELAYSRSLATEARLSTTLSTARRHP